MLQTKLEVLHAYSKKLSLLLCIALFAGIGLLIATPLTGYAAHHSKDPQVTIIKDATPSSCTKKETEHLGTAQAVARYIPCPVGTVLGLSQVFLSQAVAQHEPYVLIPSPTSSRRIQVLYSQQIQGLFALKQKKFHLQLKTLHSSNNCGTDVNESSTITTVNGDHLEADVFWADSIDCRTLILDAADVDNYGDINSLFWYESYYTQPNVGYTKTLFTSNCPYLGTNTVGQSYGLSNVPPGGTFTFVFFNYACYSGQVLNTYYVNGGSLS